MNTPERTTRTLGVDAETLRRWRSRGLLRARELHSDQLRPGCEDAAPVVAIGAAPVMVSGSDDLVAVRARPVD
jgi:predicted site-specific integrase-resolvase